ncbi:MAG: hypothetical protein WAK93_20585 [Solirubrobacteraceae bacterium]
MVGAAIAVGAIALLTRMRDRRRLALLAFLALGLVALLAGLHLTDYRSIIAGKGSILQGRYLLPVLGLLGLAVGLIVSGVPLGGPPTACGLVLGSLLMLQVVSLASVLQAFYL